MINLNDDTPLSHIGERRVIRDVLTPRYRGAPGFGGDSAWLLLDGCGPESTLLATTDPCPEPAAKVAGFDDEFYRGWLLATINLSDLAAAGARPLGLLTSLVLPGEMVLRDLERLLDGIDSCCAEADIRVVGGNLKEGPGVDVTATAIGVCEFGRPLTRHGARPGDALMLVGDVGLFWAGLRCIRKGVEIPQQHAIELQRNLLTPRAKIRPGELLRTSGVVTACMDNSDGLFPSLEILGDASGVGVDLDFCEVKWADAVRWASEACQVDPVRFAMGWGDWQLVVTCAQDDVSGLKDLLKAIGAAGTVVGRISETMGSRIRHDGATGRLAAIDSQRFAADSWFIRGLEAYELALFESALVV